MWSKNGCKMIASLYEISKLLSIAFQAYSLCCVVSSLYEILSEMKEIWKLVSRFRNMIWYFLYKKNRILKRNTKIFNKEIQSLCSYTLSAYFAALGLQHKNPLHKNCSRDVLRHRKLINHNQIQREYSIRIGRVANRECNMSTHNVLIYLYWLSHRSLVMVTYLHQRFYLW